MDFTKPTAIGLHFNQLTAKPLAMTNFVLTSGKSLASQPSSRAEDGRVMELFTTEPGVQFYTGNFLTGNSPASAAWFKQHHGFCLKPSISDSVNKPNFPSVICVRGRRIGKRGA